MMKKPFSFYLKVKSFVKKTFQEFFSLLIRFIVCAEIFVRLFEWCMASFAARPSLPWSVEEHLFFAARARSLSSSSSTSLLTPPSGICGSAF